MSEELKEKIFVRTLAPIFLYAFLCFYVGELIIPGWVTLMIENDMNFFEAYALDFKNFLEAQNGK